MAKKMTAENEWIKIQAFCVVRLGMSLADARSLSDEETRAIYNEYREKLIWEEQLTGRICAAIVNFMNAFSKNRKRPLTEMDFVVLKKKENKSVNGRDITNMFRRIGKTNGSK